MKLAVNYNDQETETLDVLKSQEFGFSKDAQEMIFTMFTKNIYSNPIGSVVREITSNCFDSHKEAGVKDAVVVRLTKENADFYISFIDNGVGMSRERITTVYAQYFNSTKRNDNNQIGGFGIGGKTPLAYGESFFLITRYNGMKYTYSIRKGTKSPVLDLLDKVKTTERNGTTIKIPVKQSDINTFEREIVRQLYYFENVIFEGFSPMVKNNYKIIEGQHFLYRGTDYSPYVHICLGRVAYPIDYSTLSDDDFDAYDWDVPVAIKLEIGDINVTASREAIDYNEATKKLIKKKLELVKQELVGMLQKQHEKLNTLEDYYAILDNHSALRLKGDVTLNLSSLTRKARYEKPVLKKLDAIEIPTPTELIAMFYDHSLFGKIKKRGHTKSWDKSLKGIDTEAVYLTTPDEKMPRKTNAYLKHTFKHFYSIRRALLPELVVRKHIDDITPDKSVVDPKIIEAQYHELKRDAYKLVESNVKRYSDVVVPEGFTVTQSKYNPNYEIPLGRINWRGVYRERYRLADLAETKAVFYYGTSDNEERVKSYDTLFDKVFPKVRSLKSTAIGDESESMPVNFVIIAKSNLKYVEELKNFKPIKEANKMFLRKRQHVLNRVMRNKFETEYDKLSSLFLNEKLFANIDDKFAKTIKELKKIRVDYNTLPKVEVDCYAGSFAANVFGIDAAKVQIKGRDLMKIIEEKTKKNGMLRFVDVSSDFDPKNNNYPAEDIVNLMQLLKLAYVK